MTLHALTPAEVGARLRVSAMTIRRRIAAGELEAVNVGTPQCPRWRVTEPALAAYLDSIQVRRRGLKGVHR